MADKYKITSRTLYSFINEGSYKFPRFQRKDTWKDSQYFELCLSVFQEYPIGSVIVNNDRNVFSLLDGRQRRTCLKRLFEEPDVVYRWAKTCCGFKANSPESDVRTKFWAKVENYLGRDLEDLTKNKEDEDNPEEDIIPDDSEPNTDASDAVISSSLDVLLEYILLIHNKLLKAFDFSKSFTEKSLNYYSKNERNEYYVDSVQLSNYIREFNRNRNLPKNTLTDQLSFSSYLQNRYDFRQDNNKASNDLIKHLNSYWNVIKAAFEVYAKLDAVLGNAEVGFIELNNASITDTQNVFSKINSGGTQLNAAELLSAKPYWNEKAEPESSMKKVIDLLYQKLKTDISENGEKRYCRWDIPATILSVVDPKNVFFKSVNNDEEVENVNVTEIAMGFKLVSSCFVGGMTKISLDSLEKGEKALDWSDNLNDFISSFKQMLNAICLYTNFNVLPMWGTSIYDILGAGASMELIAVAWNKWEKDISSKSYTSIEFKSFINEFKNHFDRLILEKMSGAYKGSGDSKMANNILRPTERAKQISEEEHDRIKKIIEDACNGTLNGKAFKHEAMRPILFYEKIILNEQASPTDNEFDIDHIYPQYLFKTSNGLLDAFDENALCNLSLLPSEINKKKINKTLNDSSFDTNTKNKITQYEGIKEDDFDFYSKAVNYHDLADKNTSRLIETFTTKRREYLG